MSLATKDTSSCLTIFAMYIYVRETAWSIYFFSPLISTLSAGQVLIDWAERTNHDCYDARNSGLKINLESHIIWAMAIRDHRIVLPRLNLYTK